MIKDVGFLTDNLSSLAIGHVGLLNLKKVLSSALHLIATMLAD